MKLSTVVILAGHPTLTRTFQAALHTCHDQLECTRCHHLQPSLETCRVLLILRGRFVILAGRLLGSGSCITVVTQPKSIHHCFSCLYACLLVWSRHIRCVYLPKVFQPYWAATSRRLWRLARLCSWKTAVLAFAAAFLTEPPFRNVGEMPLWESLIWHGSASLVCASFSSTRLRLRVVTATVAAADSRNIFIYANQAFCGLKKIYFLHTINSGPLNVFFHGVRRSSDATEQSRNVLEPKLVRAIFQTLI
jgi:hypothetical protein